jgi:ATP-dependent exoDNAse (exonuclease V) beta subunit
VPEWKQLSDEENGKVLLDEINNLYVALTRPKYKLLWYLNNKEDKTDKYFIAHEAEMLMPRLNCEKVSVNELNAEDEKNKIKVTTYQSVNWNDEKAVNLPTKNNNHTLLNHLSDYPTNTWYEKIKIAYQAPEYWDINNPKSYTEYGKLLHKILAEVITEDDFNTVIEKYLNAGIINNDEANEIAALFNKMMQNEQVKEWFSGKHKVLTEPAVLLPDGNTYRPDRVVKYTDKTIVVDFKTGTEESKHKQQILNYCHILEKLNFPKVIGYLLYLPDVKITTT